MLEDHEFCDNCPGCRPALIDVETMQKVPDNHRFMTSVNKIWDNDTTYAQRRAFIEVTLHNSRNPQDLRLTEEVVMMFGVLE